jgi:hypothetical protein
MAQTFLPRFGAISGAFLLSLLAATLSGQVAPPAPPPPTEGAKAPTVLEAFTVTGSNIRRLDEEKTLPVTVINPDDLELRARRRRPSCSRTFRSVARWNSTRVTLWVPMRGAITRR